MLTELGKIMDEHSENLNKDLENVRKKQFKLENKITKMNITLEGITAD